MLAAQVLATLRQASRRTTSLCLQSCRGFAAQPAVEEQGDFINPAAILYGPDDLRYEEHPLPDTIAPGHVRVRMRAVGICGSDVHFYKKGRIGKFVLEKPMVIGHECAGDVVGLGEGVSELELGTRVALEPGVPCWGSTMTRQGRYNLCPDVKYFATPPVHGSLARFVDHPEDFCFALPDEISYEEGAMIEPLSNGIHACRRAGVAPGKTVAILGAGPMGLNTLAAAQAFGATKIAITDVREDNLPLAERLGAKFPTLTPPSMGSEEAARIIKSCLPPDGPDCVIDCAGYSSTLQTGMEALTRGGTFVLVGMGADCCDGFPAMTLVTKEADVKGCFRYTNTAMPTTGALGLLGRPSGAVRQVNPVSQEILRGKKLTAAQYPMAIEMLREGRIDVKPMITHRYSFTNIEEVVAGFQCAVDAARTKAIKVMFNIPS